MIIFVKLIQFGITFLSLFICLEAIGTHDYAAAFGFFCASLVGLMMLLLT